MGNNDRPILPIQTGSSSSSGQPTREPQNPEDEDDEDAANLVSWREELNNHEIDEGGSLDIGDNVDVVAEMAFLIEQPLILTTVYETRTCGISAEDAKRLLLGAGVTEIEMGFEGDAARAHIGAGYFVQADETLVCVYNAEEETLTVRAVKSNLEMTRDEIKEHAEEVSKTKLKELVSLYELGCFKRMLRKHSRNPVDTRWVHTWKLGEDMLRFIKSRITMRGFKDRCEWMETFAGTATRWAQRVVNSVTVQEEDFELFSMDVGSAFAKGMTFEELSRLTGEQLRAVEFDLTSEDVKILRLIPGFEDFDPAMETLTMIKPIYGLKDAPRAWRKKLHLILTEWGMYQLYADSQLYAKHEKGKLVCLLSTHVDDLKGGARRSTAEALIKFVETKVGKCKQQWNCFTHTGIEHEQTEKGIYTHQAGYSATIKPIANELLNGKADDELAGILLASLYSSVLGGVAWMVLTRADLSVYVQALQRRASMPRIVDCKKLNLVARYAKKHPFGIMYKKMTEPLRLVCWSDAAFKSIPEDSSGLALRGCCILLTGDHDTSPAAADQQCHLVEYMSKRQRRVVRSTFSAELNALIDALEVAILVQMAYHQIANGGSQSATELAAELEGGRLMPRIDAVVDAKAVFDAIAATDVCNPMECSLKLHLLSLRDKLAQGILKRLFWSDTRDMVADGMTKGGVNRALIKSVSDAGRLVLEHKCQVCSKVNATPN